jgi:hypothetical protein
LGAALAFGLLYGCSSELQIALRDAAVSGVATFIEQQTLELLNSTLGGVTEP